MTTLPPTNPARVVVAMSGGVDSSVAAALVALSSVETIGVSMQLYDQREGAAGWGSAAAARSMISPTLDASPRPSASLTTS